MQSDEEIYLDLLVSLTDDLAVATAALATGDLSGFEQSVSRQHAICERLEQWQRRSAIRTDRSPAPSGRPQEVSSEPSAEIEAAIDALLKASKRFEALLVHSSETTSRLSNLLRSYTGYLPQSNVPPAHPSTWSCRL